MLFSPEPKSRFRYVQKSHFLKRLLCVLIAFLGVKTAIDLLWRSDDTTADIQQIDVLTAEVYQEFLTAANLELVKGPLHEPSDPDRICQASAMILVGFYGSATLVFNNDTKVRLTISDCHPCAWPVKPDEDVSAFALLEVKISDELSFTIDCNIGGSGENTCGSFRMLLPKHDGQRQQILQIIKQIAEYVVPPTRDEFNLVLNHLLSSTDASIAETDVLRLGTLLCKCVDLSLTP